VGRRIVSKAWADASTTFDGWEVSHIIHNAVDKIEIHHSWSTNNGLWFLLNPPQATWFHLAYTLDSGSVANDAVGYFDAVSATVVQDKIPNGTLDADAANPVILGNIEHGSVDSQRPLGGKIARVSIHNVILTPGEIKAAMYRPVYRGLVGYWPMDNSGVDLSSNKNSATVTNATLVNNPPVIPYSARFWGHGPSAVVVAAPSGFTPRSYPRGANRGVMRGVA
jgi:hypothetical protein